MAGREQSAGVPVYGSGWGAARFRFQAGDTFWDEIKKVTAGGGMIEHLDDAMGGRASPRVWLVVHEAGQPELSCAVALGFARELARRGQATLVLDCDEEGMALTIWTEREETEGWIDLARYGTSVLTAGIPLPFEGKRGYLLGVGSFAPTDIKPEEIEALLVRLRRQADDLILVCSANRASVPWATHADIRLLCWDRASRDANALTELVGPFRAAGAPLSGLVAFGLPATGPVRTSPPAADPSPDPEVPGGRTEARDQEQEEATVETAAGSAAVAAAGIAPPADTVRAWPDDDRHGEARTGRPGTSGVFWLFAAAFVVIIGLISGYYWKYVRTPPEGNFDIKPGSGILGRADSSGQAPAMTTFADSTLSSDATSSLPHDELLDDEGPSTRDAAGDSTGEGIDADGIFPPRSGTAGDAVPTEAPAEHPEAKPAAARAVLDMAPFRKPVGRAGWAIHVYSLPDSGAAAEQVAELHRRGFETAVRIVEIKDKGRWWRVYLGSFGSKADARGAMPALLDKLQVDWADPQAFSPSVTEQ